ncbi:MAG: RHS repeat-associated core domain-containing protein [Kiritimatiellia bacterium]
MPVTASASGRWWGENVPLHPGTNTLTVAVTSPGQPGTNKTSHVVLDNPPQFDYDDAGNMTSDGKNHYTWNDEDRLATVTPLFPKHGEQKFAYTYDHQGRRVYTDRSTYDGNTGTWAAASRTFYQYQGWNVVGATLLNPVPGGYAPVSNTACVWGVDLSGLLLGAGGVGGLLALRDAAGNLAEYHYDFNGNVVGMTDPASGQIVAEYTYDPFGKRLTATGPLAAANPFRFSTKIEEETGWNYYGYRFYAPDIGRWPNRDPIGENGGVNLLCMVGNSTITYNDFIGLLVIYIGGAMEESTDQLNDQCKAAGADACFPWDAQDEIVKKIKDTLESSPCEPITLIGHSYGGDTAFDVAELLKCYDGLCEFNIITLDPVSQLDPDVWFGGPNRSSHIDQWINIYQPAGPLDVIADVPVVGWLIGGIWAGGSVIIGSNNGVATGGGQWNREPQADINIPARDSNGDLIDHQAVDEMLNLIYPDMGMTVREYIETMKALNKFPLPPDVESGIGPQEK